MLSFFNQQEYKDLRQKTVQVWTALGESLSTLPERLKILLLRLGIPKDVGVLKIGSLHEQNIPRIKELMRWNAALTLLKTMKDDVPHGSLVAASLLSSIGDLIIHEANNADMKRRIIALLYHYHSYLIHSGDGSTRITFSPDKWRTATVAAMDFLWRWLEPDHPASQNVRFQPTPMVQESVQRFMDNSAPTARELSVSGANLAMQWQIQKLLGALAPTLRQERPPVPPENLYFAIRSDSTNIVGPGRDQAQARGMAPASPTIRDPPPSQFQSRYLPGTTPPTTSGPVLNSASLSSETSKFLKRKRPRSSDMGSSKDSLETQNIGMTSKQQLGGTYSDGVHDPQRESSISTPIQPTFPPSAARREEQRPQAKGSTTQSGGASLTKPPSSASSHDAGSSASVDGVRWLNGGGDRSSFISSGPPPFLPEAWDFMSQVKARYGTQTGRVSPDVYNEKKI